VTVSQAKHDTPASPAEYCSLTPHPQLPQKVGHPAYPSNSITFGCIDIYRIGYAADFAAAIRKSPWEADQH
jgi:hypothetical protein